MAYKPNYYPMDLKKLSTMTNISGHSPRECVEIEEASQKAVAESKKWLISMKLRFNRQRRNLCDETSSTELINFGFTELVCVDDLFYSCNPPRGWTKETNGYWMKIKDENDTVQILQFYKGAFYDRDTFIDIL